MSEGESERESASNQERRPGLCCCPTAVIDALRDLSPLFEIHSDLPCKSFNPQDQEFEKRTASSLCVFVVVGG